MNSTFHRINAFAHRCIVESLQPIPRRDRPSSKAVWRLAQNISLLSLNIRTACLVDFCRIPSPQRTLPHLIANLRKGCTACDLIFALLDSTSGDVFFVNSTMLAYKLNGPTTHDTDSTSMDQTCLFPASTLENVAFIALEKPLRVLESLPEPLLSLLSYLRVNLLAPPGETSSNKRVSDLPAVLALPSSNLGPCVQVPLAGILLDYPFAYVPFPLMEPEDNETFLCGEALDVFEIWLRSSETGESLELMKFSCPAEFSDLESSSATSTLNAIRERLAPAVEHLNSKVDEGRGPCWEITCNTSRVVVDRVAL